MTFDLPFDVRSARVWLALHGGAPSVSVRRAILDGIAVARAMTAAGVARVSTWTVEDLTGAERVIAAWCAEHPSREPLLPGPSTWSVLGPIEGREFFVVLGEGQRHAGSVYYVQNRGEWRDPFGEGWTFSAPPEVPAVPTRLPAPECAIAPILRLWGKMPIAPTTRPGKDGGRCEPC